eukprot:m.300437 g.300437  ORF g.300437 m.300437 type:complete len:79 (-) comp19555_c6_seq1:139-375(-)
MRSLGDDPSPSCLLTSALAGVREEGTVLGCGVGCWAHAAVLSPTGAAAAAAAAIVSGWVLAAAVASPQQHTRRSGSGR